jgi:hypothetical protein
MEMDKKYEICSGEDEILALNSALNSFLFDKMFHNQEVSKFLLELIEKTKSPNDILKLSLVEIKTLVFYYSHENFNKKNPFVRQAINFAKKFDPNEVCSKMPRLLEKIDYWDSIQKQSPQFFDKDIRIE